MTVGPDNVRQRCAPRLLLLLALAACATPAARRGSPPASASIPPLSISTSATSTTSATSATWATSGRQLRVDFISVGQGDAALITSPTGRTVLVDGGPKEAGETVARFVAARSAAPLDLVILTHRHADHLGGLARVIDGQGARLFLDATFPHDTPAYGLLMRTLQRRGVAVRDATAGRVVELGGGARLTLLTPIVPPLTGTRSDVNANSLVVRLDHGRVHMLLTGDAEVETERWLLASVATTPEALRADLLKVAHHGSHYASGEAFLRAVAPSIAVISCGQNNAYHHPDAETVARLRAAGARVFRTDRDGTVTALSNGSKLSVTSENQAEAPAPARSAWQNFRGEVR